MKIKQLTPLFILLGSMMMFSCNKEVLFEQPVVNVSGFTLADLPGEYTTINIDLKVDNKDGREANIADIEYNAVIEGYTAQPEQVDINQTILVGTPLELTLPITMKTADAIQLLAKLDAGEELEYLVLGTFHVDDPILNLFDLPINISGSAAVDAGFEDFYVKPELTVTDITGTSSNEGDTVIFDFNVECTVENMDTRSVTLDEIEYVVYIEGLASEAHLYSDSYSTEFNLPGESTVTLNLPVTLSMSSAAGVVFAAAIADGIIEYLVEGQLHATGVDDIETDFILPLYLEGNIYASIIGDLFIQPTIEVTGYTLKELPGDYAYLDIDMILTNNDSREAFVTDVVYTVTVEGITAEQEDEDINENITSGGSLELTLPLTLATNDAIQLLTMLDAGEELDYSVTGTFHVDEPVLNLFDLPIDIEGTATIDVGYEEFYEQPEVTVSGIDAEYTINGLTSYTFNLDVNCTVKNVDSREATIDEVEYVVFVEGSESDQHLYSDAYDTDLSIAGGGSVPLILPVSLNVGPAEGALLLGKLTDGTADYIVEGRFHVTLVDGTAADFTLPLYVEGNVPVTMVN